MNESGIYLIVSKIKPYRCYIGSASNFTKRWRCHISSLKRNKHHSRKLQNHFNKYSIEDLTFSIIEECSINNLIIREQFYIDSYNPYFNICPLAGRTSGVIKTPETCRKISEAKKGKSSSRKGQNLSQITKDKLRVLNIGKVMSEETKIKIRNSLKGRSFTKEHCDKISKGSKGKAKTLQHIQNNRLAQPFLGKKKGPMSNESKKKVSESRLGKPHPHKGHKCSEEAKGKSRLSHKGQIPWNKGKKTNQLVWNKGLTKEEQDNYKKKICVSV